MNKRANKTHTHTHITWSLIRHLASLSFKVNCNFIWKREREQEREREREREGEREIQDRQWQTVMLSSRWIAGLSCNGSHGNRIARILKHLRWQSSNLVMQNEGQRDRERKRETEREWRSKHIKIRSCVDVSPTVHHYSLLCWLHVPLCDRPYIYMCQTSIGMNENVLI